MSHREEVNKQENTFHIWYQHNGLHPCYEPFYDARKAIPTPTQLIKYYSKVREMPPSMSDFIYTDMNIGGWVQDRDNQIIVKALGTHTSMSVGDLIHDTLSGIWYKCDSLGWTTFRMNEDGTTTTITDNSMF